MTPSSRSDAPGKERRPGTGSQRLPAPARLRQERDIRRVLRTGRRFRGPLIDIIAAPSPAHRPRVGVVVPRYGHTAVARNRVRRRLKELARTEWMPAAWVAGKEVDVIIRAKPAAYGATYERLRDALDTPFSALCEQ